MGDGTGDFEPFLVREWWDSFAEHASCGSGGGEEQGVIASSSSLKEALVTRGRRAAFWRWNVLVECDIV